MTDDRPEGQRREPIDLRDDTGFIAPDQAGSMAMLSACLIAGMGLTLVIAIGVTLYHNVIGRIDQVRAELKTLQTFASCDAPKRPGDATVITYRRTDTHVAARCQVITNPTEPERAFK